MKHDRGLTRCLLVTDRSQQMSNTAYSGRKRLFFWARRRTRNAHFSLAFPKKITSCTQGKYSQHDSSLKPGVSKIWNKEQESGFWEWPFLPQLKMCLLLEQTYKQTKITKVYQDFMERREITNCFICSGNVLARKCQLFCFGMHCHLPYRRQRDFRSGSQMSVCAKVQEQICTVNTFELTT